MVAADHEWRVVSHFPTMLRSGRRSHARPVSVTALPDHGTVEGLRSAAVQAAARARLTVREIGAPDECEAACRLVREVWSATPAHAPMEPSLLRALAYAGSYVVGGFDDTGVLVGVCVGLFGHDVAHGMHSHLAAVAPQGQGRGVGAALKLHQRAWAGARGVPTISWTFDPLVGRNAAFNLHRLGAGIVGYLPDFYGAMLDGLNAGHGSDRMLVRWDVLGAPPPTPPPRLPSGPRVAVLARGSEGQPVRAAAGITAATAAAVMVAVPLDVAALRRRDPRLARAWRREVRAAVLPRVLDGWQVGGFDAAAGYLVVAP